MLIPDPLPLAVKNAPFDDSEWIFEIKHDGFRALAVIENGQCRFISRNKHKLYGLRDLAAAIAREVNADSAILDGELAVPDHHGRTVFSAMMKRRHEARFFGFDLLALDGEDLCRLPLLTRKQRLRGILPARSFRIAMASQQLIALSHAGFHYSQRLRVYAPSLWQGHAQSHDFDTA